MWGRCRGGGVAGVVWGGGGRGRDWRRGSGAKGEEGTERVGEGRRGAEEGGEGGGLMDIRQSCHGKTVHSMSSFFIYFTLNRTPLPNIFPSQVLIRRARATFTA